MPSYSTPGVYIEEINTFPPSIAGVATAIPAFIGYTAKALGKQGEPLTKEPVRITSLIEYEALFGRAPQHALAIDIDKRVNEAGALVDVIVSWNGTAPELPARFMHYSLQLYFANGGGPCYIYSVNKDSVATNKSHFIDAITDLESVDEPTLLVFPDSVLLSNGDHGAVIDAALVSCQKTQDRFTIADVRDALPTKTDTNTKVTANARDKITKIAADFLKYGSLYFPYVKTLVPFNATDADVTMKSFDTITLKDDGTSTTAPVAGAANKKLNDATLDVPNKETAVYAAVQTFLSQAYVTMPVSGAIAGVYARVDRTRGVWKAPANVGLSLVSGPAVKVTNDLQGELNIDPTTGKSVNAVRAFFGKGTLVWGARTLAGNDNEWKYVNVRRFANFVEESVEKAIGAFVFEPNDANTWVKVRTMIENFLINQWRDGALMGAKPEHAFNVAVGLGKTMSADDILNGRMIVEVHLAIVRPAEFVVLKFMQKMPTT
ncbi:MAG: phage tail sheath C-terminal domain-containing protein [Xanthomonadales bacterium]|nr:phage tail sheath C-terminal domain-containing protein [Xanthomonadales bacterium]